MTNTVIVYAHPQETSLNHAILLAVENQLVQAGISFNVLDLYADHFNGQYTADEYHLYRQGKTLDPLVKSYETQLRHCERLIFICPIWWNDVPAIVKGFVDVVFKRNLFYFAAKRGIRGNMPQLKSVQVLTTSTSPTWYLKLFCGDAIRKVFLNGTFKQLGIKTRSWQNFGGVTAKTASQCHHYLAKVQHEF